MVILPNIRYHWYVHECTSECERGIILSEPRSLSSVAVDGLRRPLARIPIDLHRFMILLERFGPTKSEHDLNPATFIWKNLNHCFNTYEMPPSQRLLWAWTKRLFRCIIILCGLRDNVVPSIPPSRPAANPTIQKRTTTCESTILRERNWSEVHVDVDKAEFIIGLSLR